MELKLSSYSAIGQAQAEVPESFGQFCIFSLRLWFNHITICKVFSTYTLNLRIQCQVACSCRSLLNIFEQNIAKHICNAAHKTLVTEQIGSNNSRMK
uniref:Short-chain dehydrogenase TIC 32ic-like isoform X2 n=1 Tax=Rhizophora mucronata TaxID=61149 RepID=A0A2P2P5T5_RHIMU